jgi:CRP-like cAMP-binding protein
MPKKPDEVDVFTPIRLRYKKGDIVLKEGDYGLSIYKIIRGKLSIFTETEDMEIPLATLGPGSVIGEMIFLNKSIERRSASARATEDSLLEVWHPRLLEMEYKEMPPVIRYLADQALNRLLRMNKLVVKLTDQRNKKIEQQKTKDPWAAQRRYYRKLVSIPFGCRPVGSTTQNGLKGYIKDISLGGAGLEVKPIISRVFPFKPGDEFVINTTLPNGKKIDFKAKIVSIKEGASEDSLFLGVSFTNLSEDSSKNLGFFLMP